ncbi:MAG: ATP-binding protein, partial [Planctomycetia bacterium]|nr:ATP-binding protein [Planctomycetia bacterium]
MGNSTKYFERVRTKAAQQWDQLEHDPELAGPWHQLFAQVQNPRHVVSELLQNADDAGATKATVEIKDGEFVFSHDGDDFTEDQFASLCRFGYSNKRTMRTIGFRGIGFKSTFSLGDEVHLSSPTLSVMFRRKRFSEPVWIDPQRPSSGRTEVRVRIKDKHRLTELEKNLSEWMTTPASLLFFKSIRKLRIQDEEVHWKSHGAGPVDGSEWMATTKSPRHKYLVLRSAFEELPADAQEEIRQERMVGVDGKLDLPPCQVELVLGPDGGPELEGRLFVVLPTQVATALPFACDAPFIEDPVRLQIKDPAIS